jgi:hypothetical protein
MRVKDRPRGGGGGRTDGMVLLQTLRKPGATTCCAARIVTSCNPLRAHPPTQPLPPLSPVLSASTSSSLLLSAASCDTASS